MCQRLSCYVVIVETSFCNLIIALKTNLESGPRFAKVCSAPKGLGTLSPGPTPPSNESVLQGLKQVLNLSCFL